MNKFLMFALLLSISPLFGMHQLPRHQAYASHNASRLSLSHPTATVRSLLSSIHNQSRTFDTRSVRNLMPSQFNNNRLAFMRRYCTDNLQSRENMQQSNKDQNLLFEEKKMIFLNKNIKELSPKEKQIKILFTELNQIDKSLTGLYYMTTSMTDTRIARLIEDEDMCNAILDQSYTYGCTLVKRKDKVKQKINLLLSTTLDTLD